MAEGKKSFVAYCDWGASFDELSNEEAGKLVKHLFDYVRDKNPEKSDKLTKMMFIPIRQTLKRDLIKYGNYIDKQRENGAKGGRPKKPKEPKPLLKNPTEPKKGDSVSVSVSVNENATLIKKEFFDSDSWFDDIARINKITTKVIKPFAVQFITESYSGDFEEPLKEVKRHFANWIKKQDLQDSTDSPKVLTSYQQQQDHIAKINKAQEARG